MCVCVSVCVHLIVGVKLCQHMACPRIQGYLLHYFKKKKKEEERNHFGACDLV